jgi:radical SAM PhpK family P-methyltransferase
MVDEHSQCGTPVVRADAKRDGRVDCVVIGYNDIDFNTFASQQQVGRGLSGAYHEVQANSVVLGGVRRTYMDLLNAALTTAQGTNPQLSVFSQPSLAVTYLTGFLRRRGFRAELVNHFGFDKARLADLLRERPRAVAITTTFYVDNAPIVEIVQFVREHSPDTTIIVGGPHVYNICSDYSDPDSLEWLLGGIGADIFIFDSQGEATLAATLACLAAGDSLDRVANLVYLDNGSLKRTPRVPENNNLDENRIDWSSFPPSFYTPTTYLRTARSCPFSCSFCNYPTLAGEHVMAEIEGLIAEFRFLKEHGVTSLVFVDDTFNVPLPRFKRLLKRMISENLGFRWISFFRCSNADDEAFALMKQSGCVGVFLGIESADPDILVNMNKFAQVERYRYGLRRLKEHDIIAFASFIVGFPGETSDSVRRSIEFIETEGPTFFNPQLYYHDLRSPIHRRADDFGIRGAGYSWSHKSMDWREAADWARQMFCSTSNSIPMTLYGLSLWGVFYLLESRLTLDQVKDFARLSRGMLAGSFSDQESDPSAYASLVALCKDMNVRTNAVMA